jgi:hypothetical protein
VAGTSFDTTRARLGDLVAAGSAVLLFISLFFNWYSVSVHIAGFSQSEGFSGWTVLSIIDILLFIIALVAVGLAVARMADAIPRTAAVSPGLVVLILGAIATILVLFRIIDIPGGGDVADIPGVDLGRSFGIFVALIASLGITAGGWIGWNEEGKPRPGGRVGGGATGAPPVGAGPYGGGQPYGGGTQQPSAFDQPSQTPVQPQATTPPAAAAPEATPAAEPRAPTPAPTPPQSVDAPPPGGAADWYPDPRGEKRLRYWDGSQWTHHTAD